MNASEILRQTAHGLYCPPGDFYIDPLHAVDRAVITHAHADHARPGHRLVAAHPVTLSLLRARYRKNFRASPVSFGENVLLNGVRLSLHPSGHIPGSAQVRLEYRGYVAVISGDYKLEDDGMNPPFEPQQCHLFVTESTFALPVFHWRPQSVIAAEIASWLQVCQSCGETPVLIAYALGKAQRLITLLASMDKQVIVHHSIAEMNSALRSAGVALPSCQPLNQSLLEALPRGAVIIAPPQALRDNWLPRVAPVSVAFVSGWMALSRLRKKRAKGRGFVLSDHADWQGLNAAVAMSQAEKVVVTHGYDELFVRWLRERGINADVEGREG